MVGSFLVDGLDIFGCARGCTAAMRGACRGWLVCGIRAVVLLRRCPGGVRRRFASRGRGRFVRRTGRSPGSQLPGAAVPRSRCICLPARSTPVPSCEAANASRAASYATSACTTSPDPLVRRPRLEI